MESSPQKPRRSRKNLVRLFRQIFGEAKPSSKEHNEIYGEIYCALFSIAFKYLDPKDRRSFEKSYDESLGDLPLKAADAIYKLLEAKQSRRKKSRRRKKGNP